MSESEKLFMGIDIGHSVIKASLYDTQGNEVALSDSKVALKNPRKGFYETDIEELFSKTIEVLQNLSKKANLSKVECIGLCGGGNGFYALDEALKPLNPGITALDFRASYIIERLKREGTYEVLFNKLGMPVLPGAVPVLLRWFKENSRKFYEKIRYIVSRKDIVKYLLTGNVSTEISDACFGVLNVFTQEYDKEIFEILKVEDKFESMPELKPNSYDIGGYITEKISRLTGLKKGTPVVMGAHDACCNTIGVGALRNNIVCTGGGTWSINLMVVDEPILNPMWSCEAFVEKGTWILEGSSPTATVSLDWFIRVFLHEEKIIAEEKKKSIYELCDEIVGSTQTRILFLPFLMGLPWGYPYQSNASACFIGLRIEDSKKELLRALYEGVTFMHMKHIEQFDKHLGVSEVRFTGGAARSEVWTQMLADALGKRVVTIDKEETGCFGAAVLAMKGSNEIKSLLEVEKLIQIKKVFYPREDLYKRYQEKYNIFNKVCDSLREIWNYLEGIES